MSQSIYFSPADRQIESFLSRDAFDRSLYTTLLFYGKLAVPDIFFFISRNLSTHLKNTMGNKLTLFEAALAKGFVIPWFRNPKSKTFHDALRDVRPPNNEKARIQGILPGADYIANRLQAAVDTAQGIEPQTWPPGIGKRYKTNIISKLINGHPIDNSALAPKIQYDLKQHWEKSKQWREKCIKQACELTKKAGHKGLQRGQLMNVVGHDVGIPKTERVHDIRDILAQVPGNSIRGKALRYFCRIINEIYYDTQANAFEARLVLPNLGLSGLQLIGSDLPTGATENEQYDIFMEQVTMPTPQSMRKVPPNELLAIISDLGQPWRTAIYEWQSQQKNERKLRKLLKEYSAAIRRIARKHSTDDHPWLQVVIGGTPSSNVIWNTLGVASGVASLWSSVPCIALAVLKLGFSIYAYTAAPREKVVVSLPPHLITGTRNMDLTI